MAGEISAYNKVSLALVRRPPAPREFDRNRSWSERRVLALPCQPSVRMVDTVSGDQDTSAGLEG